MTKRNQRRGGFNGGGPPSAGSPNNPPGEDGFNRGGLELRKKKRKLTYLERLSEIDIPEEIKASVALALKKLETTEDQKEMEFPTSLSSEERKYIHIVAQQMGLKSKSRGPQGARYPVVSKKDPSEIPLKQKSWKKRALKYGGVDELLRQREQRKAKREMEMEHERLIQLEQEKMRALGYDANQADEVMIKEEPTEPDVVHQLMPPPPTPPFNNRRPPMHRNHPYHSYPQQNNYRQPEEPYCGPPERHPNYYNNMRNGAGPSHGIDLHPEFRRNDFRSSCREYPPSYRKDPGYENGPNYNPNNHSRYDFPYRGYARDANTPGSSYSRASTPEGYGYFTAPSPAINTSEISVNTSIPPPPLPVKQEPFDNPVYPSDDFGELEEKYNPSEAKRSLADSVSYSSRDDYSSFSYSTDYGYATSSNEDGRSSVASNDDRSQRPASNCSAASFGDNKSNNYQSQLYNRSSVA